jgi:hypothetical protein
MSAKLVPTFADRVYRVLSAVDPHGRILGFLDRSRYYFFQVAPQLYSSKIHKSLVGVQINSTKLRMHFDSTLVVTSRMTIGDKPHVYGVSDSRMGEQ